MKFFRHLLLVLALVAMGSPDFVFAEALSCTKIKNACLKENEKKPPAKKDDHAAYCVNTHKTCMSTGRWKFIPSGIKLKVAKK